jgi:hypothetical protein
VTESVALPPNKGAATCRNIARSSLAGMAIFKKQEFEAEDDVKAISHAKQYVDGHDVELWQLGRRVIQLKSDKPE